MGGKGRKEEEWLSVEIGSRQSWGLGCNSNTHTGATEVKHADVHSMNYFAPTSAGEVPTDTVITTQEETGTHTFDLLPFAILCKFPPASVAISSCAALEEDVKSPPSLSAAKGHRKGGLTPHLRYSSSFIKAVTMRTETNTKPAVWVQLNLFHWLNMSFKCLSYTCWASDEWKSTKVSWTESHHPWTNKYTFINLSYFLFGYMIKK